MATMNEHEGPHTSSASDRHCSSQLVSQQYESFAHTVCSAALSAHPGEARTGQHEGGVVLALTEAIVVNVDPNMIRNDVLVKRADMLSQ